MATLSLSSYTSAAVWRRPVAHSSSARRAAAALQSAAAPAFFGRVSLSRCCASVVAAASVARATAAIDDDDVDDDGPLDSSDAELMDGEFVVEAFDNVEELNKALCLEVEENAKAAIADRGYFTLAVPGGSVAKALAGLKELKGVDWSKVHLFFVNERTPEGKCAALADDVWVRAVKMPTENVHRVGTGAPAKEAGLYEEQMRDLDNDILPVDEANGLPVFDLILLGMGADGHVGSIYPESAAAGDESGAAVLAVNMPGKRSVTMSLGLINTAERVIVAATGASKATAVRRALEEDDCPLPAGMVDAFSTIWFLDMAAASELQAYSEEDEA